MLISMYPRGLAPRCKYFSCPTFSPLNDAPTLAEIEELKSHSSRRNCRSFEASYKKTQIHAGESGRIVFYAQQSKNKGSRKLACTSIRQEIMFHAFYVVSTDVRLREGYYTNSLSIITKSHTIYTKYYPSILLLSDSFQLTILDCVLLFSLALSVI